LSVPLYQAKAELFRTLGHPARIRILELLSEREHAVHELLAEIAVEPSNLSQQLAVLRRALLVVSRRQDGDVLYALAVPEVREFLLAARQVMGRIAAAQSEFEAALALDAAKAQW
jgi:ArsR family transcriptional regulator